MEGRLATPEQLPRTDLARFLSSIKTTITNWSILYTKYVTTYN